ncbi:MAG: methyltransferase domain-containing protein [Burkholderiales bacterium]|nr:methyltransferase domain-containing protein [Burkholderiales bacterium]
MSNHIERRRDARQWFETTLGGYVLAREQAYFDETVSDIFGFNALQLGLPRYDLLRASRIPQRLNLDAHSPARLITDFNHLPIASQSVDLALMPHVLEFSATPHQILREVERVLMPEGHVIITGFNPLSWWGVGHLIKRRCGDYPWRGHFIGLPRVKDWLALLGLEVVAGRLSCYVPPLQSAQWLERLQFMEAAGDRWWPLGGGVYFLLAKKRVHSMRLIMPSWKERLAAQGRIAPAAQKELTQRNSQKETELV